ncbi:MAG: N-6 DNA methylase, partial [Helicobacter bilis]|uniref:type ISP restriction/modification enzyme n=1 Tax=Helicobacter bilis TaxID=37372 RepID=UPI0026F36042
MQEILKAYILAIKDIKESDKEHTYRPHLYNFLTAINGGGGGKSSTQDSKNPKNNIYIIHEPNNDKEGRGAPDFLITKDSLTLGYIENKRINAPLDEIAQSEQIKKYFRLSPNTILTDYLRFCFLHQDEKGKITIKQECRICEYSQLQVLAKNPKLHDLDSKAKELEQLFTLFFSQNPSSINTAKEFANALAQRTRILKDEMIENKNNASIQGLFNAFKISLYKELEFIAFADSFAQTLTYSLFLARLNNATNEKINLDNAYNFIPKSFSLIQAMSKFLRELKELDSIKWLLEDIIAIINHIEIIAIIQDLNKSMEKDLYGNYIHKDPYLHLYEDFLANYDPTLRELRGVYYTPAPVVRFIIDSIDLTLQKDFNKKGLKSALTDSNITLLDFATGTGTFLLEAFRKALEASNKKSVKYNPKALIQRFYGFEFLIAPYTIAHLKISQTFKEEFEEELNENESLNIALTNTLYANSKEDEINKQSNLFIGIVELTKEFEKAQALKEQDILIITGNPPYSGASSNKGLYEDEVRIAYGLEPRLAKLTKEEKQSLLYYFSNKSKDNAKTFKSIFERHKLQNEKNPKWLLDDYVKFIRFAESKIQHQGSGIFAFISNNSFLDNPTFRGMRYHLLKSFDKIYILDLHGNTRKKETTPSGDKDDNVFDIMQGVSINIFVKTTQDSNNLATIYHYDLYGKRKDKYDFLASQNLDSIQWQILTPQNPFYLFIPQDESLKAEYDKGWSVKDIFKVFSTGICSQRDSVVIHKTRQSIETLINDFCNMPKDEIIKKYNIQKDGRDWQIQRAIDSVKKSQQNKTGTITQIHYKPFDFYWTYFNGESRAFMAYPRTEVMQHFLHDFDNDMW